MYFAGSYSQCRNPQFIKPIHHYKKMKDSSFIARNWVDSLVKIPAFPDRCSQICSWVQEVYNAQKVLLFFHSEKRSRYTIRTTIRIHKSSFRRLDFHDEPFIYDRMQSDKPQKFEGLLTLKTWPWFREELKHNLRNAGMSWILPLWSGHECLGGLLIKMATPKKSVYSEALGKATTDFGHLLEIAFVKQLLLRDEWEMRVLLGVGKRISELKDLDSILKLMIDSIKEVIDYDAAGIFILRMPEKKIEYSTLRGFPGNLKNKVNLKVGKGIVGWAIENGKEVTVPDVRENKRYIMARRGTKSSIVVPIKFGGTVMGAFALESDKLHFFKYHDIELLRAFASQTAIVLENSKLLYASMQAAQLQKEIEIAAGIQKALLPKNIPKIKGYDIAAVNHSSLAVGGDLYDFIQISDHELGVAIGDVSGKGIPGAILMASLYSTFRGLYRQSGPPGNVIKELNESIYNHTEADKFATFFYGVLNYSNDSFTYSNAGHNPPILLKSNGETRTLSKGGSLLGFIIGKNYLSETINMRPGDVLFLYTDGVSETFNPKNQEFGENRIIECLKQYINHSSKQIIDNVLAKIKNFSKKSYQDDDITIVVVKKE